MHLTPGKASILQAPIIEESPLCIECRIKEIISLGSHDMFIADVVNVKADENIWIPIQESSIWLSQTYWFMHMGIL